MVTTDMAAVHNFNYVSDSACQSEAKEVIPTVIQTIYSLTLSAVNAD